MSKLKGFLKFDIVLMILLIAVLIPFTGISKSALRVNIQVLINVLLTMSLTATMRLAGIVSLGQAGFFAIGAYSAALLNVNWGLSPFITIPLAGLIAALIGIAIALPSLRIKGLYFALTTLAFGEVVRLIAINWRSLTRGVMGIVGIASPTLGGENFTIVQYYYFVLIIVVLAYLFFDYLTRSNFGIACSALVDNSMAASCLGINLFKLKLVAAALASFWTGVGGGFYAHYYRFVSPAPFNTQLSIFIMVMALVSHVVVTSFRLKRGYLAALFVALSLTWLPEMLRFLQNYRMVFYGLIIVSTVSFKSQLEKIGDMIQKYSKKINAEKAYVKGGGDN